MTHRTLRSGAMGDRCANCGMPIGADNRLFAYHPYAACLMFQASHNSATVEANLRAVVEYGMDCQRLGISLDRAMRNIWARQKKALR